ncbi:thromboxane A2 receptor [Alosa alosa]|uniref:thromboxane A2 receptor n=1 Tax=Alosa alosa TaxID=278164 RepID=UPI002015220D|nr:thromboxane A2 receptor [Alosa alosa]
MQPHMIDSNWTSPSASSANETPLCYSISSPPYNYTSTLASAYFSAVFSGLGLSSNLFALVVLLRALSLRCAARSASRPGSRPPRSSRSSFLIFLCGLVFTDFMGLMVTGSIVVSFHATQFNWRRLDPHCHFCNFMGTSMVFYGLCPLLLGAAMAVERFMGINRPFSRSGNMSRRRACLMVALVWLFAGTVALLPQAGVGSYHIQYPGSWCFLRISAELGRDLTFCLVFSLVGLLSLATSFLLNTVSVVTLLRVCCGPDAVQRRRDHEVEMMVQLIFIMLIASVCWCPLLMYILMSALLGAPVKPDYILFGLRLATSATWNQILDPWVYILFRRSVLKHVYPPMDWSRGSILSLYTSVRKLTRASLGPEGGGQGERTVPHAPSDQPPS